MQKKNTVASILKVYAIINAVGGLILALLLGDEISGLLAFGVFVAVAVVSFGIYAFGEVIQLLEDIKTNTSRTAQKDTPVELPDI